MGRLIDADALCEECIEEIILDTCEGCVVKEYKLHKAIDAVPVVHGRWFLLDECSNAGVYCSACRKKVYKENYANQKLKSKYCPNCGAKMDLEEDGDEP